MKINEKQLAALGDVLDRAQPKERVITKAEALAALADKIRAAKERGLTLAEIADMLAKGGLEVSEATIKRAIRTQREKPAVDQQKWQAGVAQAAQGGEGA